jgi:branched-chain amino acid aminotransferase
MIGTQAGLGVGASTDVLLFVMCASLPSFPFPLPSLIPSRCSMSPVGPYYSTGFKPVKLLATTKDVRAWPGGTGGYKLGSNYAAGVVPQQKAAALGYQQVRALSFF